MITTHDDLPHPVPPIAYLRYKENWFFIIIDVANQVFGMAHFNHEPRPWTARNFYRVKWLPEKHIEQAFLDLLPSTPKPMTPKDVSGLQEWFGTDGRFPAVHIASREVRGL